MRKNNIDNSKRRSFLIYNHSTGAEEANIIDAGKGLISNSLSKAIAYERTPSLFDEVEIADRDKELKQLQALKQSDAELQIERRNKPVVLTSYQSRIIYALSYAITQQIDSEDIREKIKSPLTSGLNVSRWVDITALTALICNSTRKRYKEKVIEELFTLSQTRQIQILGTGDNRIKLTYPLLMIGGSVEDLSPEKRNNLDAVEVVFGTSFFHNVNNRFAVITPKLFEVWGKNGRGTELFQVLLSSILSVYWSHKQASTQAEMRVRKDKKLYSDKDLKTKIEEAKLEAMTYELNVETIKQKVTTNYEGNRNMIRKFWIDLDNAIEGFKELDLIKEATIQRGAKGQDKVLFVLSESYNYYDKPETSTLIIESKIDDNEPAPF